MRVVPVAFCGFTSSKFMNLLQICHAEEASNQIRESEEESEHRYRCGASLLHQHDDFSKRRIFGFQPAALVQQANEQTEMISTASPRRRKAETAELGSAGVKAVYPGGKNQNKQTKQNTKQNCENKKLRLILKHKKAQRRGRRIRTFHLHFVQKNGVDFGEG